MLSSYAEGVNTEDYRIVKITNQGSGSGSGSLGMVNAQLARTILFNRPAAAEPTGTIYDFDYQASPTPVSVKSYIQSMFLDAAFGNCRRSHPRLHRSQR